MEFREDEGLARRILQDLADDMFVEKEVGHVAELIYCLTKSYFNRFFPQKANPDEVLIFVVGIALEEVLLRQHKQQVSGVKDGIPYSLDAILYEERWAEFKSTRVSSNKEPKELSEGWMKQILSYMYCVDTKEMTLMILHLMGNYKPPFPQLKTWRVRAEEDEILQNWQSLQERRQTYLKFIEEDKVPTPFEYNMDWECEHCRYKIACDAITAQRKLEEEHANTG
jgi:hypothetical protein